MQSQKTLLILHSQTSCRKNRTLEAGQRLEIRLLRADPIIVF